MEKRVVVAVDTDDRERGLSILGAVAPHARFVKTGIVPLTAFGLPGITREVVRVRGEGHEVKLFADTKFYDIPSVVAAALAAAIKLGTIGMMNIHCIGGRAMMIAARKAIDELAGDDPERWPLLIGVTLLTSHDYDHFVEIGMASALDIADPGERAIRQQQWMRETAVRLARLAQDCGLDGVVCSGPEIQNIKQACGLNFLTVVPNTRPDWYHDLQDDQNRERAMTPTQMIVAGADFPVAGRPVYRYPVDKGGPGRAVELLNEEINAALVA